MKEQSLIEMKNKLDAVLRIMQQLIDEQQHVRTLAAGTFETVKLLPGYDEAIVILTDRAKEGLAAREAEDVKLDT